MSNEFKPQEWFYMQNETWNGPFKTSGLKELVKKGLVVPRTLLRLGIAGDPIKAHQVKSLFPNYQGDEQAAAYSIKNEGIPNDQPILMSIAILAVVILAVVVIVFVLALTIFSLLKSNGNMPRTSLAEGIASIEKEMVLIPAGKFVMGSPASEKCRFDNETQHQVTLTKPFCMGKYEITQEQYESVMGNNPSYTKGTKLPVTHVSWEDCQEFIKKLNASTKGVYRLPYEGEWEYTCRAGTTTAYSYGDNLTKSDANIDGDSIKAVGSYRPNAFGVYDMHGNVWEWCEDRYGSLQDGEVTDPKGSATGDLRVFRGGSFNLNELRARSSVRDSFIASFIRNNVDVGFRLARTP